MSQPSSRSQQLNALLPACRRRETEAFQEVYRLVSNPLYGTALQILRQPQEAEEAVQDSFIKLFQKVDTVRGSLWSWLHRVTVNRCLDLLRSRGRRGEVELPEELPGIDPTAGSNARLELSQAVGELPERARIVLLLHDVEGLKHREIADALGVTEGTSKSQLFRAREILRRRLRGKASTAEAQPLENRAKAAVQEKEGPR